MKKNLIVLQEGNKDCGAASLLSIIRYYGGDISLERLITLTKTDKDGTNFYNISEAALSIGLNSEAYKVENDTKISEISTPFIAQINNKNYLHFVVVYKINETKVLLMDPSIGKREIDIFDFISIFTGNIMLFEKQKILPILKEEKELNKIIITTILKNKSTITFLIILSAIFTILSVISSLYSQIVFDNIIDTTKNNLIIITVLFSVLYIVKIVTGFIRNYLVIYLNQKLDISIILSTFTKVILFPYYYYKNRTTGEILSKINDLFSIKAFISKIIISIFIDNIILIISSIIIYLINRKILIIMFIVSFMYLIIILLFNYPIKVLTKKQQEGVSIVNSNIIEAVSSYETIKGLNIENNTILRFAKNYNTLIKTTYEKENIINTIHFLKELVTDIGMLCINYLIIRLVMDNKLTVGNYLTITFLSSYVINPIKNLVELINEYHYTKNTILRANNLLDIEEENLDNNKLEVKGSIRINNLSFTYNNKKDILSNISFFIKEEDKVLILGPSGTGKSTLLKIIYKYYEVERNMIYINNYDINDYSLRDIRKKITYISQDEKLFTMSIRDNIILGREIKEEEFLKVCKLTFVDEIIKDNPLGYDYLLEENGANLSGGQRQRIILARSILKNSNIIMIDEGLNEIDINLERKILINIFSEYQDKTFIIISHRKSNMDLYNRLINMDKDIAKNYERGDI